MKFLVFIVIFISFYIKSAISADFIDKGYYVIDLRNKVEWLKCSAGQQWSDKQEKCIGQPVKLDLNEIKEANRIINEQLEGKWRLPKERVRKFSLQKCNEVKINLDFFPDTPAEPFWTSQKIGGHPNFWSVNFHGSLLWRFVPEKNYL